MIWWRSQRLEHKSTKSMVLNKIIKYTKTYNEDIGAELTSKNSIAAKEAKTQFETQKQKRINDLTSTALNPLKTSLETIKKEIKSTNIHNDNIPIKVSELEKKKGSVAINFTQGIKTIEQIGSLVGYTFTETKNKTKARTEYDKFINSEIDTITNSSKSTKKLENEQKTKEEEINVLETQIALIRSETYDYQKEKERLDNLSKENLDKQIQQAKIEYTNAVEDLKSSKVIPLYRTIQNDYFKKLIEHRYNEGGKRIKDYLSKPEERGNDIEKVKYLTQQLIRFSQLEFNCLLRRKEGFMINTSLKEMQKFIGSVLFESSKKRFNKVLIENNLLKMENKIYRYNDYKKYNLEILALFNKLFKNINKLINISSQKKVDAEYVIKIKGKVQSYVKKIKKSVLKYFLYVISIINKDELKNFETYIDINGLLYYLCFTDMLLKTLVNDSINFDIIMHSLETMGSEEYIKLFGEIKNKKSIDDDTKDNNDN